MLIIKSLDCGSEEYSFADTYPSGGYSIVQNSTSTKNLIYGSFVG